MTKTLSVVEVRKAQTMVIIMTEDHLSWEIPVDSNSREGYSEHRSHNQIAFCLGKGRSHEQILELFEKNAVYTDSVSMLGGFIKGYLSRPCISLVEAMKKLSLSIAIQGQSETKGTFSLPAFQAC